MEAKQRTRKSKKTKKMRRAAVMIAIGILLVLSIASTVVYFSFFLQKEQGDNVSQSTLTSSNVSSDISSTSSSSANDEEPSEQSSNESSSISSSISKEIPSSTAPVGDILTPKGTEVDVSVGETIEIGAYLQYNEIEGQQVGVRPYGITFDKPENVTILTESANGTPQSITINGPVTITMTTANGSASVGFKV